MKKITLLFTLFAFSFGFAQNGGLDCGNAMGITPGAFTGTTIDITNGVAEQAAGANSAWFSYTPAADGTMDISSCGGGSDTELWIGTGTCGALVYVNDNDDAPCGGFASELIGINVTAGTTYYIEWGNEWEAGPFDWTLTFAPPPTCGDATGLSATPVETSSDFSWTAPVVGTPTGYNWEIQPDGVAQGTAGALASGTVVGTMVNSGVVLMASTPYEFYVQTVCGADLANYVTVGFTTTAGPPPANDDFANAAPISCGDMNIMGDTSNATLDEDDAPDGGGADLDAPNVWFTYDGAVQGAGDVTIDLCGSAYDTSVLVYTGTSGNLTFVAANDDNTAPSGCGACCQSFLTFTANGTDLYYITVEGFNFGSTGAYDMTVTCVASAPVPPNDECMNAEALTLAVTVNGTTVGATANGAEEQPTCDIFGSIADVWYSVALTLGTNDLTINTIITGTSDQANVAVYSACGGLQADSVGCLDGNGGESLTVTGLADGTYFVRVWSDGNAARIEGTFSITADATLSVGDLDSENAFTYFPNPTKNSLTLKAQNTIQVVTVYNILGQQVLRTEPNAIENDVDMSSLQTGPYFVQVTINNVTETVRIIKQ